MRNLRSCYSTLAKDLEVFVAWVTQAAGPVFIEPNTKNH